MKRIATYQLVPGMKVAEDVYNFNKQLILPKNTILTDDIITRLDFYSVISVYIADEEHGEVMEQNPDFDDFSRSYSQRLQATPEFQEFKKKYEFQVEDFRSSLNDMLKKNTKLDSDTLLNNVLTLLSTASHSSLFDMLHNMRQYSDSTYTHCMNVALICNTFAEWMNFSAEDTLTVTLCGLLHDVGKMMVPLQILNKPAKLTEEEFHVIKQHPVNGYRILTNQHVNPVVCTTALLHHEKCDGSGYPYGLPGDRLDRFTKMVTIADIYDAMTCARIYRGPLCPFKVIEILEEEGYQKYDTRYLLTFLSHIVDTYLTYRVRLSNGQEGEIIYINRQKLGRPTVKCGKEYIDLSKRTDLDILNII